MVKFKDELVKIFGAENVSCESDVLAQYAGDKSFAKAISPSCVVKAASAEQVEALVNLAKDNDIPLVPVSSGAPHYKGDTVPSVPGAVIVDLSGMKKILSINKRHRMAVIEPGVTYEELNAALAKEGMTVSMCLAPRANKSVIASLLEIEPRLNANHQWGYTEPLRCTEVTWGDGNRMFTGEAGGAPMDLQTQWSKEKWQVEPVGPFMLDFFRLLIQAQGTMGIVTWASVRCELIEEVEKSFLVAADTVNGLLDFLYKTIHVRFSDVLFVMNKMQVAALVGNTPEEIASLKKDLPNWVAVVGVAGRDLLPEMRVAQQEADIAEIAQSCGLKLVPAVGGVSASKVMAAAKCATRPASYKDTYKGAAQDVFFVCTLDNTAVFTDKMYALATEAGYDVNDIGVYIQPLHCGSAYHCEFTLPYNPDCSLDVAKVKELFETASIEMSKMGAYYTRPYGIWSRLQLNKDAQGYKTLTTLKGIFDPKGILNPGKLSV